MRPLRECASRWLLQLLPKRRPQLVQSQSGAREGSRRNTDRTQTNPRLANYGATPSRRRALEARSSASCTQSRIGGKQNVADEDGAIVRNGQLSILCGKQNGNLLRKSIDSRGREKRMKLDAPTVLRCRDSIFELRRGADN